MKENVIKKTLVKYFNEKAQSCHVDMAFLFGSYARGKPKNKSDIDIAVVLRVLGREKISELTSKIAVDISQLTKKEVDVIPIYRDFRKPMLYYNAIVLGRKLFVKDRAEFWQLYREALYHM